MKTPKRSGIRIQSALLGLALLGGLTACQTREQNNSSDVKALWTMNKKEFSVDGRDSTVYTKLFSGNKPKPLVLFLHGFGNEPKQLANLFRLPQAAKNNNFALLIPSAKIGFALKEGDEGKLGWNATESCCGWGGEKDKKLVNGVLKAGGKIVPNDIRYLTTLVKDVVADRSLNIDPKRVYIFGYSNGGFMAHTLACKSTELFAGIASYAGTSFKDEVQCAPSKPINVLQIHGTKDKIIYFDQAERDLEKEPVPEFPFPQEVVNRWVKHNGCSTETAKTQVDMIDSPRQANPNYGAWDNIVKVKAGEAQTLKETHLNCPNDGRVGFWKVDSGTHFTLFKLNTFDDVWNFLNK